MIFNKENIKFSALFMFSLLLLFLLPMVSAVKPVITTSGGLDIIYPSFEYYPQGQEIDFYWHVSNETSLLTNSTVNCSFHIYEKGQEHGYSNNHVINFIEGRDFEVEVLGGNFTNTTEYCRLIECNSATQVGAIESCFMVTPSGKIDSGLSQLEIIFILLLISYAISLFGLSQGNNVFVFLGSTVIILISLYMITHDIGTFLSTQSFSNAFWLINIVGASYLLLDSSYKFMKGGLWD